MEDKTAIKVLSVLLKKYAFEPDEEEAVRNAIGILSWSKLAESSIENRRAKREKSS